MVLQTVGRILLSEAALLLLPFAVAVYYGEGKALVSFAITFGIALIFGGFFTLFSKPRTKVIYASEGFITVALAWIFLSVVGALPFVISGEIPSFVDALFETVSGFTTTGASIIPNVEALSKSILFWRSFTHWVGGMGILVFIMAIIPNMTDRSIHIMRAEMPGPIIGKLVPKAKNTARILYLIYIGITLLEIIILIIEGMPLFESVVHSFGTAGTGGFGIKADSIGGYSPAIQYTIAIFMLIFGVNFNLYYLIIAGKIGYALKSGELWFYIGVVFGSVGLICLNIYNLIGNFADTFRLSFFQVSSIITTTGYATCDFNNWPVLSKGVLLLLMFFGGCAGSTAGGFKISRVLLMLKTVGRELRRLIHPRTVKPVRLDGKKVDEDTVSSVGSYFAIYICCFAVILLLMCIESPDLETAFTASASCFNNVGPGFAAVGPTANYGFYSEFSKLVLTAAMLLGRLEIYPLILCFTPYTWTKK